MDRKDNHDGLIVRIRRLPMFVLLGAMTLSTSCALGEGDPPTTAKKSSVLILNQSQYDVLELRLHIEDDYLDSANLLLAPMRVGDGVVFYGSGPWNITVVREHYRGGPLYAFTTTWPMQLKMAGHQLSVFDESFRLEPHAAIFPRESRWPIVGPVPDDSDL